MRREVDREVLGLQADAAFARSVCRVVRVRRLASGRCCVDDRAVLAFLEVRKGIFGAYPWSDGVYLHDLFEDVDRHIGHAARVRIAHAGFVDASVVVQNVDAAEGVRSRGHQCLDLLGVGHIAVLVRRFAAVIAYCLRDGFTLLISDVADHNFCALARGESGSGFAYAGRRACNDESKAFDSHGFSLVIDVDDFGRTNCWPG